MSAVRLQCSLFDLYVCNRMYVFVYIYSYTCLLQYSSQFICQLYCHFSTFYFWNVYVCVFDSLFVSGFAVENNLDDDVYIRPVCLEYKDYESI